MIFLNDHALKEKETIPKVLDFSMYSVWQIQTSLGTVESENFQVLKIVLHMQNSHRWQSTVLKGVLDQNFFFFEINAMLPKQMCVLLTTECDCEVYIF